MTVGTALEEQLRIIDLESGYPQWSRNKRPELYLEVNLVDSGHLV